MVFADKNIEEHAYIVSKTIENVEQFEYLQVW